MLKVGFNPSPATNVTAAADKPQSKRGCSFSRVLGVAAVIAAVVTGGALFANYTRIAMTPPTPAPRLPWHHSRNGLCIPTACADLINDPRTMIMGQFLDAPVKITTADVQYVEDFPLKDDGKDYYHWYRTCEVVLTPEAYEKVSSKDFYKAYLWNPDVKSGQTRDFNLKNRFLPLNVYAP